MSSNFVMIKNGTANPIVVEDGNAQGLIDAGLTIIDVSELDPKPQSGWLYDAETGTFTAPIVEEATNLYIHLEMTDGDGREPLGILNDGIDSLGIVATFRASSDPASPVIAAVTGFSRRVTIRNEARQIYDIVDVTFTDGVATFDYTSDSRPDVCQILESDFDAIVMGETIYNLKLVGSSVFKVYRSL